MSLVLEALKKQEAGSDPDAAVSLARAGVQRRRHRLWMALFAVAMVANLALLGWVFVVPEFSGREVARTPAPGPADPPAGGAIPGEGARPDTGGEPEEPPAGSDAGSADRAAAPATTPAAGPPSSTPVQPESDPAPAARQPNPPTRLALADLPEAARSRFPGIAFSTHIYAEDADLRAVVANGRRITEGESIRGLEVVEITETGVVLAFERYLVEVPIVMDWDAA